MSPDKLGTDKKTKRAFVKNYGCFLEEYSKVRQDYRQYQGVVNFSALRYIDVVAGSRLPLSTKAENEPNNSLFVAFALLTGAGVDYKAIGDRQHLKVLADSYGVSTAQIINGIWETLTRDWNDILGLVVNMIAANVSYAGSGGNGKFMRNVIHPYMTFLSRGYTIPGDIEAKVFTAFDKAFPSSDGSKGLLHTYSDAFKEYVEGVPMEGRHDIALNDRLKTYGYQMTVGINQCVTYQLMRYKIPVNTPGIGEVLLKKRYGVALLGIDMGMATCQAADGTGMGGAYRPGDRTWERGQSRCAAAKTSGGGRAHVAIRSRRGCGRVDCRRGSCRQLFRSGLTRCAVTVAAGASGRWGADAGRRRTTTIGAGRSAGSPAREAGEGVSGRAFEHAACCHSLVTSRRCLLWRDKRYICRGGDAAHDCPIDRFVRVRAPGYGHGVVRGRAIPVHLVRGRYSACTGTRRGDRVPCGCGCHTDDRAGVGGQSGGRNAWR